MTGVKNFLISAQGDLQAHKKDFFGGGARAQHTAQTPQFLATGDVSGAGHHLRMRLLLVSFDGERTVWALRPPEDSDSLTM